MASILCDQDTCWFFDTASSEAHLSVERKQRGGVSPGGRSTRTEPNRRCLAPAAAAAQDRALPYPTKPRRSAGVAGRRGGLATGMALHARSLLPVTPPARKQSSAASELSALRLRREHLTSPLVLHSYPCDPPQ
jgi:hypothetical protein